MPTKTRIVHLKLGDRVIGSYPVDFVNEAVTDEDFKRAAIEAAIEDGALSEVDVASVIAIFEDSA
jgi:hypothetical protein